MKDHLDEMFDKMDGAFSFFWLRILKKSMRTKNFVDWFKRY